MVGTAYYVKWLYDNHPRSDPAKRRIWPSGQDRWYWVMPIDSLRAVARSLALRETWRMLVPRWGKNFDDRGNVLEKDWGDLRLVAFSDLRPLEEAGELPSLIFSPMTVDDGRRLLISNLDLRTDAPTPSEPTAHALPLNRGSALNGDNDGTKMERYSLSGIEFFKVFPGANDFQLSTAARMSATFPWVSPAVNLPTDPPLRVVDAGYFDNFGVNIAGAWLHLHQDWIVANTSGVVLIQIRDSVSRNDRLGFPEPETYGAIEQALAGFQFLFSPVDAVLAARTTSAIYRNDQAVAAIGESFTRLTKDPAFFTTVAFENSAEVTVDQAQDRWGRHLVRHPERHFVLRGPVVFHDGGDELVPDPGRGPCPRERHSRVERDPGLFEAAGGVDRHARQEGRRRAPRQRRANAIDAPVGPCPHVQRTRRERRARSTLSRSGGGKIIRSRPDDQFGDAKAERANSESVPERVIPVERGASAPTPVGVAIWPEFF